jgi:hypothetical protein
MTDQGRPARPWDLFNKKIGRVTEIVATERFEICKACPELIQLTKTCKKCGCFMEAKTKLPNASCPLNKWNEFIPEKKILEYSEEELNG